MNFKKWVKSIQTAGYNGAGTVGNLFVIVVESFNFYSDFMIISKINTL